MGVTTKATTPIKTVGAITVNTSLMSTHNCNVKSSRTITNIVLHYTGNKGPDTAKSNAAYFKTTKTQTSAHYCVDDANIYQCIELKNVAWHCGGSNYYHTCRNATAIGIEMCCTAGNYKVGAKTVENAAQLTAMLCMEFGVSADSVSTFVIRHYDVTHKSCPAQMAGKNNVEWGAFIARVAQIIKDSQDVDESVAEDTDAVETAPFEPYMVRVKTSLPIYKGAGTDNPKIGTKTGVGAFTIVREADGVGANKWGLLKSYEKNANGWIALDSTTKV